MSGLVKAKKYDWKDSNMSLVGSDTDRDIKKQAAQTETAWKMAGKKPGLQIWRINSFKVETWPTDDYGTFFKGDSYIILNTYKDEESDKLLYDVHFWIGEFSTQDEYGTAAYKTVELDTLLDDVPVQHREVQDNESELFRSYFKEIIYQAGGAASGFRHVKEEQYAPRLFKVSTKTKGKGKNLVATQVKLNRGQITSDDAYILDDGARFYQFNGKTASKQETFKAAQVLQKLKSGRPKSDTITVDEEEGGEPLEQFYDALDRADAADDSDDEDEMQKQLEAESQESSRRRMPRLIKISESGGQVTCKQVKEGDISKRDFISNDVFLLDSPTYGVFVWCGKKASVNEKSKGITYAHSYLSDKPYSNEPVTCLSEGQKCRDFDAAIAA